MNTIDNERYAMPWRGIRFQGLAGRQAKRMPHRARGHVPGIGCWDEWIIEKAESILTQIFSAPWSESDGVWFMTHWQNAS